MLKPGGRLLISDYCRAPEEPSPAFAAYIAQRGYHLHPVQEYGQILTDAGFFSVNAEDRTWQVNMGTELPIWGFFPGGGQTEKIIH